jgi:hypothetical protein
MRNQVRITDNMFLETADTVFAAPPIELHRGKDAIVEYAANNNISKETSEQIYSSLVDSPRWISAASEVFKTSPYVGDYFTVPTIMMPTDLPNRNLSAFTRAELARFDPEIGDHVYMGWKGKPVYVEHDNLDYTKAIGAIVDVAMRPIAGAGGDIWKVIALMAIDRTKNPKIANDILTGRRRNYSMGAMVKAYQCSVCGGVGQIRAGLKSKYDAMPCGLTHASYDRRGGFRMFPVGGRDSEKRTIGFLNALGVKPFELSSVGYPAFASAYTPETKIAHM